MSESCHPSRSRTGRSVGPSTGFLLTALLLVAGATPGSSQGTPGSSRVELHPVAVWPAGPLQVIAAFDRPIDPMAVKSLVGRTIPYFDTQSSLPGQVPPAEPSGALRIVGARAIDDGRTLVLATDPHPRVARYRLPVSDTTYDLSGVEAAWSERDAQGEDPNWSGWWPELDLESTRRLALNSKPQETGLALLSRPGKLSLSALVRLPAGPVTLRIDASAPIEEAMLGDAQAGESTPDPRDGFHHVSLTVESKGEPLYFMTAVRTGVDAKPFSFKATYRTGADQADRSIGGDRLMVPWAPQVSDAAIASPIAVPDVSGGDPDPRAGHLRGRAGPMRAVPCLPGPGGKVGPDLTEVGRKGRAEIYRSIAAPSAAIAPDYTSYTVATKAGQVVAGLVRAEGPDAIQVTDTNAHATIIRREEIREFRPSATSIMPPGLASALGDAAVRDLIAFLTSPEEPSATKARSEP